MHVQRPADLDIPCWHVLYDSSKHGLSVNGFEGRVFGYGSPTVALFKMADGRIFALAVTEEWR